MPEPENSADAPEPDPIADNPPTVRDVLGMPIDIAAGLMQPLSVDPKRSPAPSGFGVGRVVHYTPVDAHESLIFGLERDEIVGGRISRVESTDPARATLHLDVHAGPVTVAIVRHASWDPDGRPGTWRYPPPR